MNRGGCLMELMSLLAGEPWTDRSACDDPVLAATRRRRQQCRRPAWTRAHDPLFIGIADVAPVAAAHLIVVCAERELAYRKTDLDPIGAYDGSSPAVTRSASPCRD